MRAKVPIVLVLRIHILLRWFLSWSERTPAAAGKSYVSNSFQHRTVIALLGILEETSGKEGGKDADMSFLRVGLAYVCVDVRTLTLEPCELELFVSSFLVTCVSSTEHISTVAAIETIGLPFDFYNCALFRKSK
jgi:hypothetical protein